MKKLLSIIGTLAYVHVVTATTLVNGTDQNVIIPPGAEIIQVPGGYEVVTNQSQFVAPTEWNTPLINAWSNIVANSSNLVGVAAGVVLTSGDKKGHGGGDFNLFYNLTQYVATGIGFYYLGGWQMFNGQMQLMMPLPLSKNVKLTPGVLGGVGTTVSGGGNSTGNVTVITEVFMDVDLFQVAGWNIGAGGFWGTITGAGPYSGNDAGGFVKGSRGF